MSSTGHDFNLDGFDDVYWIADSGGSNAREITTWIGQANGGFLNSPQHYLFDPANVWFVQGIGDFDGNGTSDLSWDVAGGASSTRDVHLFRATGWAQSANVYGPSGGDSSPLNILRVGDFNGDAHDDILWRKDSGELVGWFGGVGLVSDRWTYIHFSSDAAVAGVSVDSSWTVITSGDFNNDGRDDLIWRHTSGEITEWLGRESGFFNNGAIAGKVVDNSWHVIGAGDFNGDGRDDILWRHDSGEITEWLGQLNGGFIDNHDAMSARVDRSWKIVDIGDYNGDGKSDLLWRHTAGEITEWLGQANGTFVDNYAVAHQMVPLNWHIQSPSTNLF